MLAPANDGREKSNGDILLNTISAGADATPSSHRHRRHPQRPPGQQEIIVAARRTWSRKAISAPEYAHRQWPDRFHRRIYTTLNNVEAFSTTGNIWLWNVGAFDVGGVIPVDPNPLMPTITVFTRRKA